MRNLAIAATVWVLSSFGAQSQSITNYAFSASSGSFSQITGTAMTGMGTGTVDEGYYSSVPIGFDFFYMGVRYTSLSVSTNGWLTLGTNITNATPINNLATGGSPRPVIAPLWDDLNLQTTANSSFVTTGTVGSRIFTLQILNNKWSAGAPGTTISYQVKLYESNGRIQFVYRPDADAVNAASASIGISATGTGSGTFLSLNNTGTTPTVSSTAETNNLNSKPASGQTYSFLSPTPTAPTSLSFATVSTTGYTLNWLDNSANETGFAVYVSTDGSNFSYVTKTVANATSSVQTGLTAGTLYYWRVFAVTEGALSTALQSQSGTTPLPPTVTTPVNYCQNAVATPLTATGSNLVWTPGPSAPTPPTTVAATTAYTVTQTVNAVTSAPATINVVVRATPAATISYAGTAFCKSAAPGAVTRNGTTGGTYTASPAGLAINASTGQVTPGTSTVGTYTVAYTIAAAGGCAQFNTTTSVVITPAPAASISYSESTFCINSGTKAVTQTGTTGGTFSSMGGLDISASTGAINSNSSFPGIYTVTYSVAASGSCPVFTTTTIVTVNGPVISGLPAAGLLSYYPLTGSANDVRGTNAGTLQNSPSFTADRFNSAAATCQFNGTSQYISTTTLYTNPGEFTISIWFKTNSTTGGKLIGFGNARTGLSSQYDRHIYMTNAGQIYFGVYPGAVRTVNSALAYNDNNWHLATASLSSSLGMALYIDGAIVGTSPSTTTAENYSGYWRIGFDNMNGWPSTPASNYFSGFLDDALIYSTALSASDVQTLYNSPDGAGNSGPLCSGSAISLTATTVGSATYAWTGPNGFTSTLQNPSFSYTASNAGVYSLQVSAGGCTAKAYTTVVSSTNMGQWTGNVSTDWADAANWCSGTVPTASTDVLITAGAVRMPVILSTGACRNLTINASTSVTTSATGTLSIAGTLANSGTYTDDGTTVFNGTTGQQTYSGVTTFNNFSLNNSNGLLLPAAITVKKNLTLTAGILNVSAHNITVGGNWINNAATTALTAGTRTVTFNGTIPQNIGGSFATTFNDLIILGSASTVSLGVNANVAGNLFVTTGTFDIGTYTANRTTAGGTITVSNNSFLKIGGTNSFPTNYTISSLSVGGTVEYAGTNQAVANKIYGNLTLSSASGAVVKTMPATAMVVEGNLTSLIGSGTSVTYTAGADLTINGKVIIGASTVFNGASYNSSVRGNWDNTGTFNGNTGTVIFVGAGSIVAGNGVANFNNLTIAASPVTFSSATITLAGNLATTGPGAFTQAPGGTLQMTGTGKTITGTGISPENLTITGSVSTPSSIDITGNLSVTGSFTASAGTLSLTGANKTITGSGTINFNFLSVPGSITTAANFSMATGINVSGSLTASAGTATFTGTSTLSGVPNLFNVVVNGTSLQLSANSNLGIANVLTITSGVFNATTSFPNTVNFNGSTAQIINALSYNNLVLSNSSSKTAAGNITTTQNITIGAGATFNPGSYTISVYGNWINIGTFNAGTSTVEFVGDALAYITGATTFKILTSNTTSANTELILQSNVGAAIVNMTNGIINTGLNTLLITDTRTGNGFIYGNIQRTHTFTTGVAYAFEGPNNTINFSALSGVNSVTVSVVRTSVVDFPFGGSISRQYNIAVPAGTYTAALRLHYEDDELNGNNEGSMGLWNYNGSAWTSIGKTANSAAANYVEYTGLTNITKRWTCSDNSNVVQWNGSVSSDWNTAANWTVLQGSASAPPAATDIVNLGSAAFTNHPTISNAVTVKNINFGSVQSLNLFMASGGSLTSGDIKGVWGANSTHTINANNQTITVNGNLTLSDNTTGHDINLTIGTGTVSVNGSLQQSGAASVIFNGSGTLNIGDNFSRSSGVFTAGTGTVSYNGAAIQDVGIVNYNNLSINKTASSAVIQSSITVAGNLLVNSGQLVNQGATVIVGDVTIAVGAELQNSNTLTVGGNWLKNGTYDAIGASITFNGSGTQTISSSTFNNLVINKPAGSRAVLTGDVTIKGNLTGTSGILDIGTYFFNRDVPGGFASIADAAMLIVGANNAPNKFASYALTPGSTIKFNGIATQHLLLPGVVYGNLIFANTGQKILYTPITVQGDLTIESGASFDAGANSITLNGNWINSGSFTANTSTVILKGTAKTVSGITTFNRLTSTGSYTFLSNITLNGLLNITSTGSISGGSSIVTTLNGDLTNSGTLYALGITTFTGNVLQTLSLINAVTTVAVTVNFNGTVSPVLNSTSAPLFAILNINNTGGINPSVGWKVLNLLTVGAGASFNGGIYTHDIMGSLVNNGTITSTGVFNFDPTTPAFINFGTNFSSTGRVIFGGTGAMSISGTPLSFSRVTVSNTNAAGISPSSNWNLTSNFFVNAGSIFNAGSHIYTVGGNISHTGVVNVGTSTFILNGAASQDITTISGFKNLSINNTSGSVALSSNINVTGVLSFIAGNINTNNFFVNQASSGSTAGAAQNTGWVNGRLKKTIGLGTSLNVYEVGDASKYTPVDMSFSTVSTAGNVTVFTTAGDHPNLAGSPVAASKTVNRFWTVLNEGLALSTYGATFNFNPSDVDPGATPTAFRVANYNGSSWLVPTTSASNATSTSAADLTNFNEFVVGQICNQNTAISYMQSPYCTNEGTAAVTIVGTTGGSFSADAGLALNAVTGEIDLANSTVGTYVVVYTVAATGDCPLFFTNTTVVIGTAGLWTGAIDNVWNNAGNWSCSGVPTATSDLLIPTGLSNYPVISGTQPLHNITIEYGASVTIPGHMKVNGAILNSGVLDLSNGTIEFDGVTAQTIPANLFAGNKIKNLIISNDVSLMGQDSLTGTLTVANGKTFITNDNLILRSTATGTARVSALPVNGFGVATAAITGNISIERHLPLRNSWRLLSAPVQSASAPSINASWQEGVTTASANANPAPGYGVFVQGGTVANGFDQGLTSNPTVKVYNSSNNTFVGLPGVPGTNIPITNYPGYFVFLRGDRGINLLQGTGAAITASTLRMKGQLNTGNVARNVNATGYTVFGNPYASAINFESLTRNNVRNGFYAWDPRLSGNFGLGGYVTASWDAIGQRYDFTASVSPVSQHIASGEAVLVQSADSINAGSIVVKESDKTSDGSDAQFGRTNGFGQRVRVNLLSANANGSATLIDGVLTTYDDDHVNVVNNQDAKKLTSGSENVGIKREGKMIAIERRTTIVANDTTFLNLYQMKLGNYKLDITTNNMYITNTVAVIKDSYNGSINNMPLNMNAVTTIPFTINTDPASYTTGRFSIVFNPAAVLPVTFTNVKAYAQQKQVIVEWGTSNETNVKQYEVERSADAVGFTTIGTTAAVGNNGTAAQYKIADAKPLEGSNYYRIRSVDLGGEAGYSKTVQVNINSAKAAPSVSVYPNPVVGRTIAIQFANVAKGQYQAQLFDALGQLVASKIIQHNGNNTVQNFEVNEKFGAGKYELQISGKGVKFTTSLMK